jgi:signal transduction histidine kinase
MRLIRRSLKRRIIVTIAALVWPALALVGYLATEVSRREFARLVLVEPPDAASHEQQARQLADAIGAALDGGNPDVEPRGRTSALLGQFARALDPGLVVLVTGADSSFIAAHPSGRVRIDGRAPDGTLVVEGTATSGAATSRWRLHVRENGPPIRDRTGRLIGYLYVLEDPDVRLRRQAEFTTSIAGGIIVVVLLAGALSMAVGAALARRIVRPVEELTSLAVRFGAGDLTARSHEGGRDEMGLLTRSFNEMADRLVEAEKIRRSMLTDIAHELRTPLTNVRCQLEAVQDRLLPPTAETIGSLTDEVLSLMRVIDDLQDLALAEAGRLRLQIEPCDVAMELHSLGRASARPDGPSIDVQAGSPLVARVDPKRFRQIVRNLIANAVAALPPAGHVTVSAAAAGENVRIQVLDDGPGVPPEYLPRVFDRYYRVMDRESPSGGTGLGLAIVKRLVELHGGTITAGARPEGGMVFSLTLPGVGASWPS